MIRGSDVDSDESKTEQETEHEIICQLKEKFNMCTLIASGQLECIRKK